MKDLILIESIDPKVANLIVEDHGATGAPKQSYLSGIFMQADVVNGNGRVYPVNEITSAVKSCTARIAEGLSIFGELNHPDNLTIDLNNVSHIITELKMEGPNAIGKARILNTPKGQLVKAILEGGGKLGVSSRGTGNVNEGQVSDFQIVTVDIVATPSAQKAYPNHVMESLSNEKKIMTLAEATLHDKAAQKYFASALADFFEKLTGQQLKK